MVSTRGISRIDANFTAVQMAYMVKRVGKPEMCVVWVWFESWHIRQVRLFFDAIYDRHNDGFNK